MRIRISILLVVLALLAAACGGGAESGDSEDAAEESTTTAAAETTTTEAETTTTAAESTTTTAAETTTTEAEATTTTTAAAGDTLGSGLLAAADYSQLSGRFEGVFDFVPSASSELPDGFSFTIDGEFDNTTASSRILMDLGAAIASFDTGDEEIPPFMQEILTEPLEIVTIGDTSWMKWGFFALMLGTEAAWIELPADETGSVTSEFGFGNSTSSPLEMLEQLDDAEAEIEDLGTETIRGVETTHYRAVLDLEKLRETLPPEEAAEFEAQFGGSGMTEFPLELWIDDEGLLHRYRMEVDAGSLEGSEDLEAMTMTFDLFDYGADIDIQPPPPEDVTSAEELGGFIGG